MKTEILTSSGKLLSRYPVLFCDVWGVLHDGVREYPAAGDALEQYRAQGGRVLLLSNAPIPGPAVAKLLDEKQVRRSAWDAIVSSGDVARLHMADCNYRDIHHIGPDRSLALFERLNVRFAELDAADVIICTGLVHDTIETADSYRPILQRALARQLPFLCANPDRVVEVGGKLLPCAGAIGAVYANMGGAVYWAGKPNAPAYALAFAIASQIAGRSIAPADVLAIGDAALTDLAGAALAGIDALFIAGGIHRARVMTGAAIDTAALPTLLVEHGTTAIAAAPTLVW